MEIKLVVEMDEKEVKDAIMTAAKVKAGDPKGGSSIHFVYDGDEIASAIVTFQHQKN
jgi:hypothetical protein